MEKQEEKYQRVMKLLEEYVNEQFFNENYSTISVTISTYIIIKKIFKNNRFPIENNHDFQSVFSQFYGIRRFVSDSFLRKYYNKMEELRNQKEYDIEQLTKELIDKDKNGNNKIQFSFVTKLLNIMNDDCYPIYDSNVAKAFGIYSEGERQEDRINNYIHNYKIIQQSYYGLLKDEHCQEIIKNFRIKFKQEKKELSDMRIIDLIIWKLGEKLIKKQITISNI